MVGRSHPVGSHTVGRSLVAWAPTGLGRRTDLDFLLVVVDLPGDVHVHRTPLPWFLQEKYDVVRRPFRENRLHFPKASSRLGLPRLFHETTVFTLEPLPEASQCPGRGSGCAVPSSHLEAGNLSHTICLLPTSIYPGAPGECSLTMGWERTNNAHPHAGKGQPLPVWTGRSGF